MVKKTALLMIFLLISISLFADSDQHGKSLEYVLGQIREELKVDKNSQIDPELVSEGLLEELGEAVMGVRHPDERQHEWMDNMMGGEGSESLRNAHIMMGYNYLSGAGPSDRFYGRGFMRNGFGMPMMGFPYNSGWGMHRFFFSWGGIAMFIVLIALVLITVFVIIGNRKKENELNPLDILKKTISEWWN